MAHPTLSLFRICIVALACAVPANAQMRDTSEHMRLESIGLYSAAAWSTHSNVPGLYLDGEQVLTIDAEGIGFAVAVVGDLQMSPGWGLRPQVTFESWRATSDDELTIPVVLEADRQAGDSVPGPTAVIMGAEVTCEWVAISLTYFANVLDIGRQTRLAIEVGPSSVLAISSNLRQTMSLDQSVQGRFANQMGYPMSNDGRELVLYDSKIPEQEGTRLGLIAGLRLTYKLSSTFELSTGLHYDYSLTSVTKRNWRASALSLGAGLQVRL